MIIGISPMKHVYIGLSLYFIIAISLLFHYCYINSIEDGIVISILGIIAYPILV